MAMLTFNTGNTLQQSLRAAPSKTNRSKLRYNIEQSEGQRVAEVFYPSKYLPVQFQDVNTEDWVVITKGKVVSALGLGEYLDNTAVSGSLGHPHASGSIPVFNNRSSTVVTTAVDDTFWGYNETVNGLLVPANGGRPRNVTTANAYEYTANDITAGTYRMGDSLVSAAGEDVMGWLASGNIPIGFAMGDMYQDIRGQNLNYGMWDKWAIVNDYFITCPFVREGGGAGTYHTGLGAETSLDDETTANSLRNMTYMTIPSGVSPRTGCEIKPDIRGNYIVEAVGNLLTDTLSIQTVGRLITLDTRFPKDMLQYVDTYEGSQMAGTDTGGLPYWLFMFAYNYLLSTTGSAPSIYTIVAAVKSGRFGMARFQFQAN